MAAMECHGFAVDTARMREMWHQADENASALATNIREAFDEPGLNPGSPEQLVRVFKAEGVDIGDTAKRP